MVRKFEANLDRNLHALGDDLRNECVRTSGFTRFVIYDPKERIIAAPSFRDRVLHHAIMNVCEPHLDRWLVHDCRSGLPIFRSAAEKNSLRRKMAVRAAPAVPP